MTTFLPFQASVVNFVAVDAYEYMSITGEMVRDSRMPQARPSSSSGEYGTVANLPVGTTSPTLGAMIANVYGEVERF